MTTWPSMVEPTANAGWRSFAGRVTLALLMLAMSAGIILGWAQFERLGFYGYPAVFVASLLANLAIFLPAPGFAVVLAAGKTLDPITVGLLAGLGAALGEMTGYLIGMSGQTAFEDKPIYWRIQKWMGKSGVLAIFLLAAVPNPFFDMGGLVAGALRMPVWRFLTAAWIGKALRYALLASIGALAF